MYPISAIIAMLALLLIFTYLARKKTPPLKTSIFPRYTTSARRVIFFARWHAQQLGASAIRPEHLLLGLIFDQNTPVRSFLLLEWDSWFEGEIKRDAEVRPALPKDTDLPLDNASKRILAYTTMEADALSNKHIGTEHLLLGILREKSAAAELLAKKGISLEKVRTVFKEWTPDEFSLQ